ncbi:MAG: adenylyl-sulfate kinase, partial [Planctomycetaceae bacterium]
MSEQKATNITWHESRVGRNEREQLAGHRGVVVWFTGLSASGKSTVANEVDHRLHAIGKRTYVLDGDNVRHGLNKNLGFSAEDRAENIRRIGEVAGLFVDAGTIVLTAFI